MGPNWSLSPPLDEKRPNGCFRIMTIARSSIAVLSATLLLAGCGSSADSTANEFMSALVAGRHLKAEEMLSKDMRGMATLLGGLSNRSLNSYYRSGNLVSFVLTRVEQTDNSVRYRVIAVTKDGRRYEDFMDMVREDGSWKVSRF